MTINISEFIINDSMFYLLIECTDIHIPEPD